MHSWNVLLELLILDPFVRRSDTSRGNFPILSRDPNLSRKPPKNPGKSLVVEKNDG